ncbi:hypothetical protein [Leifsonia sp. Leaf264]|uniref:hypothetical protein n=1 Tax=Leifsonia sp. Leaf264 TaxID=1736314 RepID=UPI0006FD5A4D|nr:hypothetical protein [Leifsonia sp. Leaf264]KQO98251.1 hypothetical protein ASF30_09325 [Leifsonia sp. Leaf264]
MSRHTYSGQSIEEAKRKATDAHGPKVRFVEANRLQQGGIAGFLSKTSFEVVVDSPEPTSMYDPSALLGLLDEQDSHVTSEGAVRVSTASSAFDDVFQSVTKTTGHSAENTAPPQTEDVGMYGRRTAVTQPIPPAIQPSVEHQIPAALSAPQIGPQPAEPSRVPGDLVLVVGFSDDALATVRAMARAGKPVDIRAGGAATIKNTDPINDRRSALPARADAVGRSRAVYVAYGIGSDIDLREAVSAIQPDQVWAVVDASMKTGDTAAWVTALPAVDGLAVVNTARTSTPETANLLGVPIGFVDGEPAVSARL